MEQPTTSQPKILEKSTKKRKRSEAGPKPSEDAGPKPQTVWSSYRNEGLKVLSTLTPETVPTWLKEGGKLHHSDNPESVDDAVKQGICDAVTSGTLSTKGCKISIVSNYWKHSPLNEKAPDFFDEAQYTTKKEQLQKEFEENKEQLQKEFDEKRAKKFEKMKAKKSKLVKDTEDTVILSDGFHAGLQAQAVLSNALRDYMNNKDTDELAHDMAKVVRILQKHAHRQQVDLSNPKSDSVTDPLPARPVVPFIRPLLTDKNESLSILSTQGSSSNSDSSSFEHVIIP